MKNLFSIEGKTAIITGGSSGIGAMIAEAFVQNGVKTYITSRKADALEEKRKEFSSNGKCIAIQSDLSDTDGINRLFEEIGSYESKIDILINNAGTAWASSFEDFPEKGWDKVMDINLKSPFFLTQKFLPLLKKSGKEDNPSRVINIASINGITHPLMPTYSYSSSKSALIHLTRHLGADMARYNINVNAIAPGFFPSKMTSHIAKNEALSSEVIKKIPIKRMGSPEDIAGTIDMLLNSEADFINCSIIYCDGGESRSGSF